MTAMDITSLYYDNFLSVYIDYYRQTIKQATAGHCMKVTGFALGELQRLVAPFRAINPEARVYILSDDTIGPDFIHATKLIELRNDSSQPLLVLIPVNSRTSAEDSYGDATFKDLAIDNGVKAAFLRHLEEGVPNDQKPAWQLVRDLLMKYDISQEDFIRYLLHMELKGWEKKAWGECLFCVGLLPDSRLLDGPGDPLKRFIYNIMCTETFCDFSISASEKAQKLPIDPDTLQRDIVGFFMTQNDLSDSYDICERIYMQYPGLYFSEWDIKPLREDTQNVIVNAELMPGKDSSKELVKDSTGDLVLQLRPGRKGKVKIKMTFSPSPDELPELQQYQVQIIRYEGYAVNGDIRTAKINVKGNKKMVTLNIPFGDYEDGNYFLRVHALDANGVQLDRDNPFVPESVQAQWEEYLENTAPDATPEKVAALMEQFQQEHNVMHSNETTPFYLKNADVDDEDPETDIGKRKKVDNMLQAYFHYRMEMMRKGEEPVDIEIEENTQWKVGSLNDVYAFDFGNAVFAYQIQNSRKLLEIERLLLKNADKLGSVYAEISGNPTEQKLQEKGFNSLPDTLEAPRDLLAQRKNLFSLIESSSDNRSGALAIFPFFDHIEEVRQYVRDYSAWVDACVEAGINETPTVALQNIDIVDLKVEMPDGSRTVVKLISPLHPLRLAWMVNLYDLFSQWEQLTRENPALAKQWYKKLDKLFLGELPLEVAPLVLANGPMEIFQYVGEITFGWGMYAIPTQRKEDIFGSEFRQLKSYLTSLLNIAREKQIESDVNLDLVFRHLENYCRSHLYADKLVINLFNAGDANVFADALVRMERQNIHRDYEIRLFSEDNLVQPGGAFRELLDPDSSQSEAAETFSVAAANRLFPKLRFSVNSIQEFLKEPRKYQAHVSFLITPFPVTTEMVRPDHLARSFFLNATVLKSAVSFQEEGTVKMWNRYFAENSLPMPIDEFANDSIVLFGRLESLVGKILSSTATLSVPATCLSINERDAHLLSFIHQVSDWVVTFDKNMGPEFYDLPLGESSEKPYLLDYIPGQERSGISSFLTTLPNSEIEGLMRPQFEQFGISVESKLFAELLEDVRAVSSSMVMQTQTTQNKAFEVLGITLTKRLLAGKGLLKESFIIPIDLHKELFADLESQKKERADSIVVNIDTEQRRITMTVVEIKCRQSLSEGQEEELEDKIVSQLNNTVEAMEEHFGHSTSMYATAQRLDHELKTMELADLLGFYINRAKRYGILAPEVSRDYLAFLTTLGEEEFEIDYRKIGIIFNLDQEKKQIKTPYGEATIYKMGRPVIDDILSEDRPLDTMHLDAGDREFISEFPRSRRSTQIEIPQPVAHDAENEDEEIPSVMLPTETEPVPQPEPEPESQHKYEPEPQPEPQSESQSESQVDPKTSDYEEPKFDLFIGSEVPSTQFGIIGQTIANNRKIALDLDGCNTISLFGRQGAGKSYTIGVVTEMMLRQFSSANRLPAPLASVIFHYSETMDYAPEFTSMIYLNDSDRQLARLKAVYGVEPGKIEDVLLLTTDSKLDERREEYPNIEVQAIGFDSKELQVKDWMFLLGAVGNDSTYIREFQQILRRTRNDLNLKNIRNGVKGSQFLSQGQKNLAMQRIGFAENYIKDGVQLQKYLKPGRLIIVDLRDEFVGKDEALGLFVVMLNIFSGVKKVDGKAFNKFIVFDEAHKYMDDKKLVDAITTAIREMRHKGVSIMIASQDPVRLAPEIIELSSVILLHCFNSPAWVQHMKKAVTALGNLSAVEMAGLGSGEAYLWAAKANDRTITTRPVKISIRPRITKHGGDTIQASQS
ncbi:MAG: ATP-binding protein [Bacteroidales bacterium]|nr:ATP-binding protein [Bacteroidales bacterium]